MAYGTATWCMAYDVWPLAEGLCGLWFMVYENSLWQMTYGVWRVAYGR